MLKASLTKTKLTAISSLPLFNPGDLRHLVSLQRPVSVSDGAGGTTTTYMEVADVRASVERVITGRAALRDTVIFGTNRDVAVYRIIIRYNPAYTIIPKWRISWTNTGLWPNPRVFEISAWPANMGGERFRYLELTAKEVTELSADPTS